MAILVKVLIVSLPFVAYPRMVGSTKLSDVILLLMILFAAATKKLHPTRLSLGLALFVVVFAVYGFININYVDRLTVLGGWDVGLLSTTAYPVIAAVQSLIYIFGFLIAAPYLVSPKSNLMRFQLRYFILWSFAVLILYAITFTRSWVSYTTFGATFFCGTFAEKGVMAAYVTFTYAMVVTYLGMPDVKRFPRWEIGAFLVLSLVDLALCRSDRGTIYFVVFNLAFFCSKRPTTAVRFLPAALLIAIVMLPALLPGSTKIRSYFSFAADANDPNSVGRYAGVFLFPTLFTHAPLLGLGYGNYIFYRTSAQFAAFLPVMPKDEPDCIAIQILLETGIVGALWFFNMAMAYPLRLLSDSGRRFLWPFAITYVVSLMEGVTTYYQVWLWLFVLIQMIQVALASSASTRTEGEVQPLLSPRSIGFGVVRAPILPRATGETTAPDGPENTATVAKEGSSAPME